MGPLLRGLRRLAKHRLAAGLALAVVAVALAFLAYWHLERRWAHADWICLYDGDFTSHPGDAAQKPADAAPAPAPSGVEFLRFDLSGPGQPWAHGLDGLHPQDSTWLWLKDMHVPGDVRVTAVVRMEHPDGLEICIDSRREPLSRIGWVPTGYSCQFGGYLGSVDLLSRNPMPRMADINNAVDSGAKPGVDQTVVLERRGERLALWVDGQLRSSDDDPLPLTGSMLDGIGLHTYCQDLVIRSLKVERLALPEKASPLIVGDALVQAGAYHDAITSYLATARDHPGGDTAELALTKAYFAAMRSPDPDPALAASIRQSLDRSFPASRYQSRLLELDALHAWNRGDFANALALLPTIYAGEPDARTAVRLLSAEHPHLGKIQGRQLITWLGATTAVRELDLGQLDLDSIAGLEPLALRRLTLSGNRIASLAPLARMPLTTLDIGRNLVQSLDAVGGLPLTLLAADDNLITSVAPLIRCPALASLDIRANAIPTLAPLRGLPLTHLDAGLNPLVETPTPNRQLQTLVLDRCGLWDLQPLAHSHLIGLELSGNRIHDLSPLAGLPLQFVNLRQNHITDLAPLGACKSLCSASFAANQVTDLAPLLQPALTSIYCEDNRIRDLAPLRGHHLAILRCAGNPITTLEPLLADPPEHLLYDDGTIPLDEIARAGARWRVDGRTLLARQTQVLLAARHGDIKELLRLAHRSRGRAYLMVPMACSWDDANARAQALGGHLVSITDAEQLEEISLDGESEDVWIGLRIAGTDTRWEDGTPLQFNAFPYPDIHQVSGPVHLICDTRLWFVRAMPSERLPFMVAWDDVPP